ncbi:MAG TPA: NUDIX hydrolase [Rhodospirillales bacterium]|nr:NUDIX hydrolase [Rhodospirillales bacterium]
MFDKPPKIEGSPVSAKAVLFARKNMILLLQKTNGQWDLPGGKLRPGESWTKGLAREILEETGLEIESADWISGWMGLNANDEHVYRAIFLCKLDCKPKKSSISISGEHVNGKFFEVANIRGLAIPEEYLSAIDHAAVRAGR